MSQQTFSNFGSHPIIFEFISHQRTGVLVFQPQGRKLFFEDGRLIFASSENPEEHFSNILVQNGVLTSEDLRKAKSQLTKGESLGKKLKSQNLASAKDLAQALKQQITAILEHILSQPAGSCHIQEDQLPAKLPRLKIQTLALLLQTLIQLKPTDLLDPVLKSNFIEKSVDFESTRASLGFPQSYDDFFSALQAENDPCNLDSLVRQLHWEPFIVQRLAYALTMLGMLRFSEPPNEGDRDLAPPMQLPITTEDEPLPEEEPLPQDALADVLPETAPGRDHSGQDRSDAENPFDDQTIQGLSSPNETPESAPLEEGPPDFALDDLVNRDAPEYEPPAEALEERSFEELAETPYSDAESLEAEPSDDALEDSLEGDRNVFEGFRLEDEPSDEDAPIDQGADDTAEDEPPLQVNFDFNEDEPDEHEGSQVANEEDPAATLPNPVIADAVSQAQTSQDPNLDETVRAPFFPDEGFDRGESDYPIGESDPAEERAWPSDASETAHESDEFEEAPIASYPGEPASRPRRTPGLWTVLIIVALGLTVAALVYLVPWNADEPVLTQPIADAGSAEIEEPKPASRSDASLANSSAEASGEVSEVEPPPSENDPTSIASETEQPTVDDDNTDPTPPPPSGSAGDSRQPLVSETAAGGSQEPPPAQDTETRIADLMASSLSMIRRKEANYSVAFLVACEEETLSDTLQKIGDETVYVLPRMVNGRDCRLFCWGAFTNLEEAAAARQDLPESLRLGQPWVVNLKRYLE